jgi:hypothetical protein
VVSDKVRGFSGKQFGKMLRTKCSAAVLRLDLIQYHTDFDAVCKKQLAECYLSWKTNCNKIGCMVEKL